MKNLLLILAFPLIFAGSVLATTTPKGWMDDLEQAKEKAAETGRPIMALFTGSDWCPWCIKLKKDILEQKKFQDYAADQVILLYVDLPKAGLSKEKTAVNQQLCRQYGVEGFPTVLLLDAEGKMFGSLEERQLTAFLAELDRKVKAYRPAAAGSAGDSSAKDRLKAEIKAELKEELKTEIKAEVKQELKQELQARP